MDSSKLRMLMQSNLALGSVALAAGILAAWLGARQLDLRAARLEQDLSRKYATASIVVASRDVPKGQLLDASLLSIRSMPRAFAPADALAPDSAGLLIGARAAIGIRRGTPVVQAALMPQGRGAKLSESLPDGMRALTIQVDQLNSISGHLEAGDMVDLHYSRNRGNGAVLVPLLLRVTVLATGHVTQADDPDGQAGEFTSVTLLVSAADAKRVVLAEQTGRLTLLLRHGADEGEPDRRIVDSAELLRTPRAGPQVAGQATASVELLVGGNGGVPARSWLVPGEGA
jgi:pilus assembly protein CpaB